MFDWILDQGYYSERDTSNVMRQVLEAVAYLHSLHIVHRNLKVPSALYWHLVDHSQHCMETPYRHCRDKMMIYEQPSNTVLIRYFTKALLHGFNPLGFILLFMIQVSLVMCMLNINVLH